MNNNFEKLFLNNKNHFKRYNYVKSDLIYGNLEYIKNPLITIAIPTYRRVDLLKLSIDSALDQVGVSCEYEIIVVDNDADQLESDTSRLIKTYNNGKVLYYKNRENIGMFGNWNRCIELSRGKWIAFLHDDDMLCKSYIKDVVTLLNRKNNIGALMSSSVIINNNYSHDIQEENKRLQRNIFKSLIHKIEQNKLNRISPIDSQIMNGNIFGAPTCGSIFKKKYMLETGGFDEDYFPSSDWFFLIKFSSTYKVYKTKCAFGYYRIFENESLNPDTLRKFIIQAEDLRKYLSSKSKIGKALNFLFPDEQYFSTLSWVKKLGKNSDIDFEVINKEYGYSYRPIRFFLYNRLKSIYWYTKRIITLIFG